VDAIREKIEQVLKAEEEAKRMIEDARNQCDRILRNAREKVREITETMMAEAENTIALEKVRMEKETNRILEEFHRRTGKESDAIREIGTRNITPAVSYIVKSIME
jgi:vacuolar-type H+-ATPase subunit H